MDSMGSATATRAPEMTQRAPSDARETIDLPIPHEAVRRMNAAADWTGPDDPENPRNFPGHVRAINILIVMLLAFSSCFSGSIYAPAQDAIMEQFNLSYELAVLPLSMYNLGMAFGPIVGAPLSETYGRKAIFVTATPAFILFMIGAGFANSIASLTICRFFAGLFASSNINNASATILDYTASRQRGVYLGVYYSIPSTASTAAPLVGGFVNQALGWRWTQWVAVIFAICTYIPVLFTHETYKKVILRRRARRMGITDSSSQIMSVSRTIRYFVTILVVRPLHMLFTEPIVMLVSIFNGFLFGLLYVFVTSVPWIFRTYYGFDGEEQSLSYLGVTLGTILACVPFTLVDTFFYQKRLRWWQQTQSEDTLLPPEYRLVAGMIGSILLPLSLLAGGWTTHYHVHWACPIIFQGLTQLASLMVYASVSLYMLDAYGPLYAASASSAMMLSRYSMSFAFPFFALSIFKALGVAWTSTILGGCTLLMAPIPWCFWVFGSRIRARSKYETSS